MERILLEVRFIRMTDEPNLIVLNDPPYGTERSYNGLRLAATLAQKDEEVRVFLVGGAASCARKGQKVPQGYYNVETMIDRAVPKGATFGACGTCMDARGLADGDLAEGAHRGTLMEWTDWTIWADKVLVF